MKTAYRTIDFRPAPPGWRLVHLNFPGPGLDVRALAGWLVQEEIVYDSYTLEDDFDQSAEPANRPRRVVPGYYSGRDDGLVNAEDDGNFWTVIGPGDAEPTAEEEAEERQRRTEELDLQRRATKKATTP